MGWFDRLLEVVARGGWSAGELARRLDVPLRELRAVKPAYDRFEIRKRTGGVRVIHAPREPLRSLQRRILRRLLARLEAHPAAHGFERGRSIVTHARLHASKRVVVKLDVQDFFTSTTARRLHRLYRRLGWGHDASSLLATCTTWMDGLPQGAPTSPRLSNLVNVLVDARLQGLARARGATYSRYADDLAFSFEQDDGDGLHELVRAVQSILREQGYRLHTRKKLRVMRRHDRQTVCGLVVNERVDLPRALRRRLRAIEHRLSTGRRATLAPESVEGWCALRSMIHRQRGA